MISPSTVLKPFTQKALPQTMKYSGPSHTGKMGPSIGKAGENTCPTTDSLLSPQMGPTLNGVVRTKVAPAIATSCQPWAQLVSAQTWSRISLQLQRTTGQESTVFNSTLEVNRGLLMLMTLLCGIPGMLDVACLQVSSTRPHLITTETCGVPS